MKDRPVTLKTSATTRMTRSRQQLSGRILSKISDSMGSLRSSEEEERSLSETGISEEELG